MSKVTIAAIAGSLIFSIFGSGIFFEQYKNRSKIERCEESLYKNLNKVDFAKYYGLPEKFKRPSYNAIYTYIGSQLWECTQYR